MKKPSVVCPAAKEIPIQESTGKYVVLCDIVYQQFIDGKSNYESYFIVPSNCEESNYCKCHLWREEKEAGWARNGNYSSLEQREKIYA